MRSLSGARRGCVLLLLIALLSVACTSTEVRRADGIAADSALLSGKTVLLLPPEVQLTELKASGLEEPRADWTDAASAHIEQSFRTILGERGTRLMEWKAPEAPEQAERFRQLRLLHDVVGQSAAIHGLLPMFGLPSKAGRFDWTVGPGARELQAYYKADYALFTSVHDSYATGARKSMMVVGLLLGVSVSTGQRFGYSTLVDLRDGRVIWAGILRATTGDIRNADGAMKASRDMLEGAPL